jgi:hypothetical protein
MAWDWEAQMSLSVQDADCKLATWALDHISDKNNSQTEL